MDPGDLELIRDYAAEGSQAAFAELVHRHVDLVYSAARRQVRSQDLAAEVTQSVFLALARHGHKVKSDTPLIAWLYLVTRRTAINCVRAEMRRRVREQTAFEIAAMNSNSSAWPRIEPLLDEAMESLSTADRSAILLRYFENKSLGDVGRMLGTSEDAAQKRVSRALERLRDFFSKRGVAVGATALAANLATGAVQIAPLGLGLTISSAVAVSGAGGQLAALQAIKTFAMTTTQKTLIGAALVAFVGAGFYGQRLISRQRDELRTLREQVARSAAENGQLRRDRADDAQLLQTAQVALDAARTKAAGEARATAGSDPATDAELKAVSARMNLLKMKMAQLPDQQIPELRLLHDQDWINAAARHKLTTDDDLRAALRQLRVSGKVNLAETMGKALWNYAQANAGLAPTDIMLLAPYFDPPVAPEMLQRYGIVHVGKLSDASQETSVVAETAPDEGNHDPTLYMSGPRNQINQNNVNIHSGSYSDVSTVVLGALADFIKARTEQPLTDPAQLVPYLKRPVDPTKLNGYWKAAGLPNDLHSPHD